MPTRANAVALLHEWNANPSLRKHGLLVEAGVGGYAIDDGLDNATVESWGIAGLLVLPRSDVGGAIGAALLAVYLVRGRAPETYAGVFLVVAWLELYGSAIGTWEWAVTIPGTPIAQGNPPSGVAAGYVWFDIVALTLAPPVIRWAGRIRSGWRPLPDSA